MASCSIRREVEPRPPFAILDFDDPKIRVEADFSPQAALDLGGLDPVVLMGAPPEALDASLGAFGQFALRRRSIKGGAAVEPVKLDEDRAGFRRASPAQDGVCAFDFAAPDVSRDPDVGA